MSHQENDKLIDYMIDNGLSKFMDFEPQRKGFKMDNQTINAIERILDKRVSKEATDKSLIGWLEHLKTVWKYDHIVLDGFISAIKQTPLNKDS